MSIPVDLASLSKDIERVGAGALLITAPADGPPHVASVLVTCEGEDLLMGAGRRTHANAKERPAVTLVWPTAAEAGYCLIVDGTASDGGEETFVVHPTSAVMHRLAGAS